MVMEMKKNGISKILKYKSIIRLNLDLMAFIPEIIFLKK